METYKVLKLVLDESCDDLTETSDSIIKKCCNTIDEVIETECNVAFEAEIKDRYIDLKMVVPIDLQ